MTHTFEPENPTTVLRRDGESSRFRISYVMRGENLRGRLDDVTTELTLDRAYLNVSSKPRRTNGRLWRNYSPREQLNSTTMSRTLLYGPHGMLAANVRVGKPDLDLERSRCAGAATPLRERRMDEEPGLK